jgi:hypothetical protein
LDSAQIIKNPVRYNFKAGVPHSSLSIGVERARVRYDGINPGALQRFTKSSKEKGGDA